MNIMLKIINFFATAMGEAARSAAENGIGFEFRERFGEFVLRIRRSGLIFVGTIAGLIAYSLIFHSVGLLLWIIALPLAAMAALLSMLWPTRRARLVRRSGPRRQDLAALARSTRLRMDRRVRRLPVQARSAADDILRHLNAIAATSVDPDGDPLLRGEAERLVGRHLPRLVNSYCDLPANERRQDSEADQHLTEGLKAIAVELGELSRRLSKETSDRFEIERRFVALRFPSNDLAEAR